MSRPPDPQAERDALERWFAAAIAAVDPEAATRRALADEPPPTTAPAILAFGKAALGMARGAEAWLAEHGLAPREGLVVTDRDDAAGAPVALPVVVADHPVPAERSLAAAERLAATIASLPTDRAVLVLISGGTSALLGAPLDGVSPGELRQAFALLHELGLDIHAMNALRRQLTRWSGGRLAAALGSRAVRALVISDVLDNDLAVIGSGPLVGGAVSPETVAHILSRRDLIARLPASVIAALGSPPPVTTRPIPHRIVADRGMAVAAAAQAASAEGIRVRHHRAPLTGEAADVAAELTMWLAMEMRRHRLASGDDSGVWVTPVPRVRVLHLWSGEMTVTLPADHGIGGRAQQFALVAARALERFQDRLGFRTDVVLLAAGTDGRDGPTDAAGAVIDDRTAERLRATGVDVDATIARYDAHGALDAVGALVRTGSTGTNVADLVLALTWNWY